MGHSEDDTVHKIPHKMKTHWQNQLKILVLVKLQIFMELDNHNIICFAIAISFCNIGNNCVQFV